MADDTCSVSGCGRSREAKGYCDLHYRRWRKYGSTEPPPRARPFADRFWAKVDRGAPDECWPWLGARSRGYGHANADGHVIGAHRVALWLQTGTWPEVVMHVCDNPPCVNPAHLRAGTHAMNMADAAQKDRTTRGSRNSQTVLTADQVREIRRLAAQGITQREIARSMGVCFQNINAILRGKVWAWLDAST